MLAGTKESFLSNRITKESLTLLLFFPELLIELFLYGLKPVLIRLLPLIVVL
jgi:hypothetical protein